MQCVDLKELLQNQKSDYVIAKRTVLPGPMKLWLCLNDLMVQLNITQHAYIEYTYSNTLVFEFAKSNAM